MKKFITLTLLSGDTVIVNTEMIGYVAKDTEGDTCLVMTTELLDEGSVTDIEGTDFKGGMIYVKESVAEVSAILGEGF